MERTKALNTLLESSDLVRMLEEMMNMGPERLGASMGGMKLTLKAIRERIIVSHDILAREAVQHARAATSSSSGYSAGVNTLVQQTAQPESAHARDPEAAAAFKRSLRAQIEKAAEK